MITTGMAPAWPLDWTRCCPATTAGMARGCCSGLCNPSPVSQEALHAWLGVDAATVGRASVSHCMIPSDVPFTLRKCCPRRKPPASLAELPATAGPQQRRGSELSTTLRHRSLLLPHGHPIQLGSAPVVTRRHPRSAIVTRMVSRASQSMDQRGYRVQIQPAQAAACCPLWSVSAPCAVLLCGACVMVCRP